MKVYTVACVTPVSGGEFLFIGLVNAGVSCYDTRETAQEEAARCARLYPGETFWVIEGEPLTAHRVEPQPVSVIGVTLPCQ